MKQKFERGALVKSRESKDLGLVLSCKDGVYELLQLMYNYCPCGVRSGYLEGELYKVDGPDLDVDELLEEYGLAVYSMM